LLYCWFLFRNSLNVAKKSVLFNVLIRSGGNIANWPNSRPHNSKETEIKSERSDILRI
jgi:hypothetical protein